MCCLSGCEPAHSGVARPRASFDAEAKDHVVRGVRKANDGVTRRWVRKKFFGHGKPSRNAWQSSARSATKASTVTTIFGGRAMSHNDLWKVIAAIAGFIVIIVIAVLITFLPAPG
jgi:hypothetical protein